MERAGGSERASQAEGARIGAGRRIREKQVKHYNIKIRETTCILIILRTEPERFGGEKRRLAGQGEAMGPGMRMGEMDQGSGPPFLNQALMD